MKRTKKKLLFLCDGNATVGLGHFIRCLILAKELRIYGMVPFFSGAYSLFVQSALQKSNFPVVQEPVYADYDGIFVDKYGLSDAFFETLNAQALPWGGFVDDALYSMQGALFAINFRLDADVHYTYSAEHVYLGPSYFPVDKAYIDLRQKNSFCSSKFSKKVLICLGGVDLYGTGRKLAETLGEAFPEFTFHWVTEETGSFPKNVMLKKPTHTLWNYLEETGTACIGGGRIKYEMAYAGILPLTFSQTGLQEEDTLIFETHGLSLRGIGMGTFSPELAIKLFQTALDTKIQESFYTASKEIFSLDSTKRLAREVALLYSSNGPIQETCSTTSRIEEPTR